MISLTLALAMTAAVQDAAAQPTKIDPLTGPDVCVVGSKKEKERMAVLRTEIDAMAEDIETLMLIRAKSNKSANRAQKDVQAFSALKVVGKGGVSTEEDYFAGTRRGGERGTGIQASREHAMTTAKKINRVITLREKKIVEFREIEKKLKPVDCNAQD